MARGNPSIVEAIEAAQIRAAELDALIIEWREKEKAAVEKAVREAPGTNAYDFGTAPKKARATWQKAVQDREMLDIELDALAVARAREIAGEADKALAEAIKEIRVHRPALESLYAEAGQHVAALADLWLKVKDEIEAFDGKVAAGRDLAAAAVTNPDAQGQWADAAWGLSDLGPLPANVAYFVEIILAAALDPQHTDEYRVNAMRTSVGIPDVTAYNVPANFSGDRHVKRGGSSFADSIQTIARRNEPLPVAPPPTAEQIANEAARAAEVERRFAAQQARKQQDAILATWPQRSAAAAADDLDADTASPDGLNLTDGQRRELAELQTR